MASAGMRGGPAADPEIGAVDPRLLDEPIEFLEIEHYRQRAFLQQIEGIPREPRAERRVAAARATLGFLKVDLALHIADEDTDFHPLLRSRCQPSDGVDDVLAMIAREPSRDMAVLRGLEDILAATIRDRAPPDSFAGSTAHFAQSLRRLLGWEDAFLLPLARRRLTETDKRWLADRMIFRRESGKRQ